MAHHSRENNFKTALVTGADGFTGRYMTDLLAQRGYHVVGMGHTGGNNTIICDLRDSKGILDVVRKTQPDVVVHLAALSFVGENNVEGFYQVNLFGTIHLLEALDVLETPPKKILIASSANVYGTSLAEVIDETVCPAPVNHYANSKLAMEHMVRTWFDRLNIIITRPFNYTGPNQGERFLIPKIIGHFRRREREIKLGNLEVSRDFSDVRDVVRSYVALLESESRSVTVNICSGIATSLMDVINMLNDYSGYQIKVSVDPVLVRSNEVSRLQGNNDFLKKLIDFTPEIPFDRTLWDMFTLKG